MFCHRDKSKDKLIQVPVNKKKSITIFAVGTISYRHIEKSVVDRLLLVDF